MVKDRFIPLTVVSWHWAKVASFQVTAIDIHLCSCFACIRFFSSFKLSTLPLYQGEVLYLSPLLSHGWSLLLLMSRQLKQQHNNPKQGKHNLGMPAFTHFFAYRMKMLKDVPYTPEEAERAAGMGSYTLTRFTKPLKEQEVDMTTVEGEEAKIDQNESQLK